MTDNKENFRDDEIRRMLKTEIPSERNNPWFTRKVLNRLPPRRRRSNPIEKWMFLIIVIGVTIGLVLQSAHMLNAQVIYVRDFVMMGAFLLTFLGLSIWIIYPYLRD